MTNPFSKAKFDSLVLYNAKYLIQIDSKGVYLTKTGGSGDEKNCNVELSWDEIYDMGGGV